MRPSTPQTNASGRGIGGTWRQGEGEEKRPVSGVSRKPVLRETLSSTGAAGVSSHQMDHRPFQVPSAGYRIQLREWPQGSEMVRNHETLELPAGCCQRRHTASHQVSSSVFFGQVTSCLTSLVSEKDHPTRSHKHSVFSLFLSLEIGGELDMRKWQLRFICLLQRWRMLLLHIDADNYTVWLMDYRKG